MKKNILHILMLLALITCSAATVFSQLDQARIYINPGHGGWGSNDRPLATINYEIKDTLGFFETNTNLWKALSLRNELLAAGAGYIKMSRTVNGITREGEEPASNDKYKEGDVVDGVTQIVTLAAISEDVETNNMDYFLSIHSNADKDGNSTNYPLLLYRGTDTVIGNGLTNAKKMALDAWKYIINNGATYYSYYTGATQSNVRGDVSFWNGDGSTGILGYYGYYGVLKHGTDGFLSEGCFHTYHPERHRLLNRDYCRQEGVRYARAIRAWFGDTSSKTTGDIMGTVKDKYKKLEHALYKYAANSVDAHYPLNNMKVVLKNASGTVVDEYTTDKEYNGIYVFTNLEPGKYSLVFDYPDTEYIPATTEVEVKANETTFVNQLITDQATPPPYPYTDPYYPTPDQPGDIIAPNEFKFEKEYDLTDVETLRDLTIRRAILKNNKYYVLAVNASKEPKLLVINPATGELIKEMSTTGVLSEGYNGKEMPYILSDIAFTTDGVLIGTNSTVVGKENNAYQTANFYVYKWEATETVALEDVDPVLITQLSTNIDISIDNISGPDSLAAAGNNNSNLVANSIAVKGNIDDFYLYFDSHAGDNWTSDFSFRLISWKITNGVRAGTQWTKNDNYNAPFFGETHRFTYSPFGDIETEEEDAQLHRFVVDGAISKPVEFRVSWTSNEAIPVATFNEDIPVESSGINFFRYLDRVYMTTAVCEPTETKPVTYSYKACLYDVTDGIDNAVNIGTTDAVITGQPAIDYMATAGVVDGAGIELYLMVGNNIVKYKSKAIEQQPVARIFASQLAAEETESGYTIQYTLNEEALAVNLILKDKDTGAEVKTISLSGLNAGANSVEVPLSEIPEDGEYTWAIQASGEDILKFVKISDDSSPYRFFGPRGVAIDKTPESPYFGRVYITNTDDGTVDSRATTKGVYILGADGTDITSQGDNAHTGGIAWTTAGQSPRKVAVAADGRVFVSDYSISNSGIYYMNPETFEMETLFPGATREETYGKLTIGETYVGGRTIAIGVYGEGADTRLYGVDRSILEGNGSWAKNVSTYHIGESNTWTTAPTRTERTSPYIGNENNSLVPVDGGYWAAQYRGSGSSNTGNPFMYYYNIAEEKVTYNSHTNWARSSDGSSQNGGLAVNEKENLIVLAFDNGAAVFTYEMNENAPVVSEKFITTFNSSDITYDDFEFDYAGNLYAVSYDGKLVSVWTMPTSDNTCITPAQKTMLLKGEPSSIVGLQTIDVRVYPNPIKDYCVIESDSRIHSVDVLTYTGILVDRITNNEGRSVTLNTSHYQKGLYLIKINNQKTVKVIKQ